MVLFNQGEEPPSPRAKMAGGPLSDLIWCVGLGLTTLHSPTGLGALIGPSKPGLACTFDGRSERNGGGRTIPGTRMNNMRKIFKHLMWSMVP
jgi:hypothetical protein